MRISPLVLGPRLSRLSWSFIEGFFLLAIFFLPFSKSVAEAGIGVSLVLWGLRKWPWNEKFPFSKQLNIPYAVFLAITALSLTQIPAENILTGLRGLLKWLKYLGVFFLCWDLCQDKKRLGRLLFVFFISMMILCFNGFFQAEYGRDLIKKFSIDIPGRYVRIQSSLDSPNNLACFLLMALPLIFYYWAEKKWWNLKSFALLLLLALATSTLAATFSRSGVYALALAVFLCFIFYQKKVLRVSFILIVFSATLFSSHTFQNFVSSMNFKDITIGERLRFWHTAWEMIKDKPFLGQGVNMFYQKFGAFAPVSETYRGYAHNCYLQMWSEVGPLGLVVFLWPLGVLLGRPLFFMNQEASFSLKGALWISLTAYLFQAFVDTNFYAYQTAVLFWVIWGIYAALSENPASKNSA